MTFKDFIGSSNTGIVGIINNVLVPVIFAFALIAFVWGIVQYFFIHGGNETKREEGKQFILWGIIGMVVLFSVWGLVHILLSTLNLAAGN